MHIGCIFNAHFYILYANLCIFKMHIYAYEHILFEPGRRLFKPGRPGRLRMAAKAAHGGRSSAWWPKPKPPQLDALRVSRVLGVLLHCVVCCLDRLANHVSVLLGIRETSCSPKCSCITISAPSRVLVSAFSAFLASLYSLEISS